MNTFLQKSLWISCLVVVLGLIVIGSLVISITLIITGQPISQVIVAFGLVALAGLARILISPLNQKLFW